MPQKISDSELITRVDQELRASQDYMGGKLAQQRRKALQYYMAQPEGDLAPPSIDGRSAVVSTDVADTIEWMLPSLLRIFTASDRVVQLSPRKPGMDGMADDATDYLNWIFSVQNDGFQCLYSMFKDAMLSKFGVLKVWWDSRIEETRAEYFGLSDLELIQLLDEEGVEVIEHSARTDPMAEKMAGQMNPAQAMQQFPGGQLPTLHDVTIKRRKPRDQICIEPVPPEEFFISRQAKKIKDAPFVAHVREWVVSDLRAAGYDIADDEIMSDEAGAIGRSMERVQRWSYDDANAPYPNFSEPPGDPSMRRVWVVEAYLRADVDGDGIAEWRRVMKIGQKILENEECDGPPFVGFTPIPMPHRLLGMSIADVTMETQKQKTAVMRASFDSLYMGINGRTFAVEGQVNLDDLLTIRPGGVVRVKSSGAVGPLQTGVGDMAGAQAMLEYLETQKENRSGFTRYSQGADAGSLNKTATGVSIVTNRSDMRVELIARVAAETGVKDLFVKMLELVCKYQSQPAEFNLNGRWLNIDPREWRNQFDVTVNVGLGTNDAQQRIGQITQLMSVQQQLAAAGTGIVTPKEAYASAAELVKALGYKDAQRFLKDPASAPPQPPKPDPKVMEAQAKLQIERMKAEAEIQLSRERLEAEIALRREEMTLKYQAQAEEALYQRLYAQSEALVDGPDEARAGAPAPHGNGAIPAGSGADRASAVQGGAGLVQGPAGPGMGIEPGA